MNEMEARALLERLEYQKGNIEAALHVFEGIDIAAVTPRMKGSISRRCEQNRRHSQSDSVPPMSMHDVSLLLEAVLLKAKSLQGLGRYEEAAQSCKVILDTVESVLPDSLPENFTSDCKLQDTLSRAVESLPEFWSSAIRIIGGFFTKNICEVVLFCITFFFFVA
ncbi:protein NPGR2-like [Humulus lupulus]|uniref:protein NPGR2-like n=1 Tax=Humulus lupulus TaxID=3486 RepID=UPI002B401081|nr:protein NPGR2-like [Humulus lupulus]